jgi:hypothetical protein
MQAVLWFTAAALAVFAFPRGPSYRYVLGVAAAMIGASVWRQDTKRKAELAAKRARIEAAEDSGDATPT